MVGGQCVEGSEPRKKQKEQANLLLLHRPSCLTALLFPKELMSDTA